MVKTSQYKGKILAAAGETGTIISISGKAVICEKPGGKRYPCGINDIALKSSQITTYQKANG